MARKRLIDAEERQSIMLKLQTKKELDRLAAELLLKYNVELRSMDEVVAYAIKRTKEVLKHESYDNQKHQNM